MLRHHIVFRALVAFRLLAIGIPLACIAQRAVTGTVVDETGRPVAAARVTLFAPSSAFFRETRTDAAGSYSFELLRGGTYRLGVAARGFRYAERGVTVADSDLRVDFATGPDDHPGRWSVIGNTGDEYLDSTDIGVLTADGRILYCHDTKNPLLFDPATGGLSAATPSPPGWAEQGCMNVTLLDSGEVLMVGGQSPSDPGSFRNAVRWVISYDPALDSWTREPDLLTERWYPGLARLADGTLLAMGGGRCCDAARIDRAEVLDPATGARTEVGRQERPNEFPPAALLHTGEVLKTWFPPELFDSATGSWRTTGGFVQSTGDRGYPDHSDHSLVVLADGRALVVGVNREVIPSARFAEIYDPATETWSLAAAAANPRKRPEVALLPDGKVLAAAGEIPDGSNELPNRLGVVRRTDLYDPRTDAWTRMADMLIFREYHAATLLVPDGRVVSTGGTLIKFQDGPTSTEIEAFEPPYLFRGVRPEISDLSATVLARGDSVTFNVFPATRLTHVALVGTSAVTHWVDGGVPRLLELPVTQTRRSVTFSVPADANRAPVGHYMLFAMVDDIPSKGVVVRVAPAGN